MNRKRMGIVAAISSLVLGLTVISASIPGDFLSFNAQNSGGTNRLCLYGLSSHTHSVPPYSNMQITSAEISSGEFTRNTDANNSIHFYISSSAAKYDNEGDLVGFGKNAYMYNTTPLNGINYIDYKWKQYDMYIDFGYEPINYKVEDMGDETHLPETVIKRVKISGNPSSRGAKSGIFDDSSFFSGEDFNYIRFQACDSSNEINWLKGIDIYYSCTPVLHFVHKAEKKPFHGEDGMLEHYLGSNGVYYDLDKNMVSRESLVVPNTATKQYVAGRADYYTLSKTYEAGDTFVFDVDLQTSNEIQFTMYQDGWSSRRTKNCKVYANGTNNQNSFVKSHKTDDGWVRVEIDVAKVVGNESYWTDNDRFDRLYTLKNFYINNGNTGVGTGDFEIEVNPSLGHEYGEYVEEVVAYRGVDGVLGHYQCEDCGAYFDGNYHYISDNISDLTTKSNMTSATYSGSIVPLSHEYRAGELLLIDVKFDADSVGDKFSFTLYAKNWAARCKDIVIWTGSKTFAGNSDISSKYITLNDTEDGYLRFTIDLSKMDSSCWRDGDSSDYNKFEGFFVNGSEPDRSTIKGSIELEPKAGLIYRGNRQVSGSQQGFTNFTAVTNMNSIMNIDIKHVNSGSVSINLYDDWNQVGEKINLDNNGLLNNNVAGVLVYKVDDVEGYVTGYYRIRIDLSVYNTKNRSKVNRVCTESQSTTVSYMHINPDEEVFVRDTYVKLKTGVNDVVYTLVNPVTVADSIGLIPHKKLTFNVKGVGTGIASFVFMNGSSGWANMSAVTITFEYGFVTGAKFSSLRDVWATYENNSDGSATITIDNTLLPGDGILGNKQGATATSIGNIRVKSATNIDFSIDVESIRLIDNGSHSLTHMNYQDAHRQYDGNIDCYRCEECGRYFDSNNNPILQADTIISNRFTTFDSSTNSFGVQLPQQYALDEEFAIDFYVEPTASWSEIGVAIGDHSWSNYVGYFWVGSSNNSLTKLERNYGGVRSAYVDDNYLRIYIKPSVVIEKAESSRVHGSLSYIDFIYIKVSDGLKATGSFEWQPTCGKVLGQQFTAGTNLDLKFDNTITAGAIVTVDITFKTASNTKLNLMLFDSSNWSNYFGYYQLSINGKADPYVGVSYSKIDNETARFIFDMSALTKVSGNKDAIGYFNEIYVRGDWTDASGYINYTIQTPGNNSPVVGDIY